uniref:Uncharacterized protein n=1 Tax=Anguilla anguilla TaxID=7936 RepID=A0A0E9QQQ3_ANGAN
MYREGLRRTETSGRSARKKRERIGSDLRNF